MRSGRWQKAGAIWAQAGVSYAEWLCGSIVPPFACPEGCEFGHVGAWLSALRLQPDFPFWTSKSFSISPTAILCSCELRYSLREPFSPLQGGAIALHKQSKIADSRFFSAFQIHPSRPPALAGKGSPPLRPPASGSPTHPAAAGAVRCSQNSHLVWWLPARINQ